MVDVLAPPQEPRRPKNCCSIPLEAFAVLSGEAGVTIYSADEDTVHAP